MRRRRGLIILLVVLVAGLFGGLYAAGYNPGQVVWEKIQEIVAGSGETEDTSPSLDAPPEDASVPAAPLTVSASAPITSATIEEGIVILSHSSYVDDFGYFHIVGEVENVGLVNTERNQIAVTFFDAEGYAVDTITEYSHLDVLRPGQRSPFEIVVPAPPPSANYGLRAEGQATDREPYGDFDFRDVVLEERDEGWSYLSGSALNAGGNPVDLTLVVVTFYDASSMVVGVSLGSLDVSPLDPGDSSSFTVPVAAQVVHIMESYELQAEALE